MTRFLLAFAGTLMLGSTGAFFLFVPPLLIVTVTLLLMGFLLMFVLGLQVGTQTMLAVEGTALTPPQPVEITPSQL